MDIEEASNGKEGIKKVKTYRPHLIFLEIHLPAETGLDIARQIKTAHPDIIIVILTSYDFPEYQIAAEESGGAHLIPKDDWTGEDIVALVHSIMVDLEMDEQNERGGNKLPPHQVSELCKNDA